MGNCPSGFQFSPSLQYMCVVECPTTQGLELRNINGEPFCVYRDRPEVKIPLRQVATPPPAPEQTGRLTLEQLQTTNPAVYPDFKAAKDDFDTKLPVVMNQIQRNTQIADAFRELQNAENVRDQSPQAYQAARIRYYTLVNGDGWVNEESRRIAAAEVNPKVTQYTQMKNDLKARLNQQQQTIDVATNVKDKVLTMRDDFAYTTNAFAKQISDLKNQINIEKKKASEEKIEVMSGVDMTLNLIITALLVGLLVLVVRKYMRGSSTTNTSSAYRPMTSIR